MQLQFSCGSVISRDQYTFASDIRLKRSRLEGIALLISRVKHIYYITRHLMRPAGVRLVYLSLCRPICVIFSHVIPPLVTFHLCLWFSLVLPNHLYVLHLICVQHKIIVFWCIVLDSLKSGISVDISRIQHNSESEYTNHGGICVTFHGIVT